MSAKLNNIAVLIDADNASANSIGQVLQEIAKHGILSARKYMAAGAMLTLKAGKMRC